MTVGFGAGLAHRMSVTSTWISTTAAPRPWRRWLVLALGALAACGGGGTTYVLEQDPCMALRGGSYDDVKMDLAHIEPAADGYPAHCLVRGHTLAGRVAFELRSPMHDGWNGRLLMQGTGGFSGQLDPALGHYRTPLKPGLLADGYAVATTDAGHTGAQRFETYYLPILDGSWGLNNPVAEEDFAWRGSRATTLAAQQVLRALHQGAGFRTYYVGCSGAGRLGMKMAEKADDLFDGFVIGDPPLAFSLDMLRMHWNLGTALALPLPLPKLRLISQTVMARCDALDGVADGLVSDPERCSFNPFELRCTGADGPDCLTAGEAVAAFRYYGGPQDSAGHPLAPGLPPTGSEDCNSTCDVLPDGTLGFHEGWPWWFLGGPRSNLDDNASPPVMLTLDRTFGRVLLDQFLRYLAFEPDRPDLRWFEVDLTANPGQLNRAQALYNVSRVDFSAFRSNGKRILMYSGWADAFVSPLGVLDYRRRMAAASGGVAALNDFYRLFMVPGMQHCEGGRSLDDFDAVRALVNWVEQGQAPDTLMATNRWPAAFPGRARTLCAYPAVSTYEGSGSTDDAASFACRVPAP